MGLRAFVLLVVAPITELLVIVRVAGWVGWGPTLLALILAFILGTGLMRRSGRDAWQVLRSAVRADSRTIDEQGRAVDHRGNPIAGAEFLTTGDPAERARRTSKAITKSGVRFAAGLLLALPGFLSDVVAVLLLLPPVSSLLAAWLVRRASRAAAAGQLGNVRPPGTPGTAARSGTVITGTVVSETVISETGVGDPPAQQNPDGGQDWPGGGAPNRPVPRLDPPTGD